MPKVHCRIQEHVAVITIDNPPMNALDEDVMRDLPETLEGLRSRDVRAVVLIGEGKAFIAGADIEELTHWTPDDSVRLNTKGQDMVARFENFPAPVIAALNGYALGGGLELALACDIRIASSKAKLGLPETRLGIIPGYGGSSRLPKMISPGQAKKMIFTGEHITAEEAHAWGIVQEVTEPEDLLPRALQIAERISANAPVAVRESKRLINECRDLGLEESLARELRAAKTCYASEDSNIGLRAFLNKEKPEFTNR